MNSPSIDKKQIKLIHTLTSKLGIDDNRYRLMLSDYWVETSKKLTYAEAEDFIKKLEMRAISEGVWKNFQCRKKYEHLGNRKGMASPRQIRMIEAMWKGVSWTHDEHKKAVALRRFIFRIAGVDDLVFLTSEGSRKVIKAIQSIKGKHTHPCKNKAYGGF